MSEGRLQSMQNYVAILNSGGVSIPRNDKFTRADVVRAFESSFELIGGVRRLALWAHENETEFFRLYAKLLPSATVVDLNVRVSDELNYMSNEQLEQILLDATDPDQTD